MICLNKNITLNQGRYQFNDIVLHNGRISKITNIKRCEEPQPWDEITFDDESTAMPGNIKDVDLSYKVLLKLGFKKLTSTFSNKRPTDYTYDGYNFRMIYTIATGQIIIQPKNGELQSGKLFKRCVRALQRVSFTPKKFEKLPEGTESYYEAANVHLKDLINFDILINK
jgi:hypothetical protein